MRQKFNRVIMLVGLIVLIPFLVTAGEILLAEFSDDFKGDVLNESKWEEFHQHGKGGEYTIEEDGIVINVPQGVNRYGIRSVKPLTGDFIVEEKWSTESQTSESWGLRFMTSGNFEYITFRRLNPDQEEKSFYQIYTLFEGVDALPRFTGDVGTGGIAKVKRKGKKWLFYLNDKKIGGFDEPTVNDVYIYSTTYDGANVKIEYIKTYKPIVDEK